MPTHHAQPRGPQRLRLHQVGELFRHRWRRHRPAQAQPGRQELCKRVDPAGRQEGAAAGVRKRTITTGRAAHMSRLCLTPGGRQADAAHVSSGSRWWSSIPCSRTGPRGRRRRGRGSWRGGAGLPGRAGCLRGGGRGGGGGGGGRCWGGYAHASRHVKLGAWRCGQGPPLSPNRWSSTPPCTCGKHGKRANIYMRARAPIPQPPPPPPPPACTCTLGELQIEICVVLDYQQPVASTSTAAAREAGCRCTWGHAGGGGRLQLRAGASTASSAAADQAGRQAGRARHAQRTCRCRTLPAAAPERSRCPWGCAPSAPSRRVWARAHRAAGRQPEPAAGEGRGFEEARVPTPIHPNSSTRKLLLERSCAAYASTRLASYLLQALRQHALVIHRNRQHAAAAGHEVAFQQLQVSGHRGCPA